MNLLAGLVRARKEPNMKPKISKTTSVAILSLAFTLIITGCETTRRWVDEHRPGIAATGQFLASQAGKIAAGVLQNAVSYRDSAGKADYIDGLASAFRSVDYTAALEFTGSDIEKLVDAWSPDNPHWGTAANRFAQLWDAHPPRSEKDAAIFVEAVAGGLNTEAYRARVAAGEALP